jgi:predicted anti-sigma-YlaC factor YlaD
MEHREAQERLNDYAEGLLSERDRKAVAGHLESCAACRDEAAALRALLDAAGALPRSLEPERDLWPGVRSRIAPARSGWTRFVMRWEPVAAAAALAIVVAAAFLIAHRGPRPKGEGPTTAQEATGAEQTVPEDLAVIGKGGERQSAEVAKMIWALEEESMGAGKVLVAALEARPGALTDQGLTAIDAGLRTLDKAINESAAALRADPENPKLVRQLTGYYRQRLSILRRATELAREA